MCRHVTELAIIRPEFEDIPAIKLNDFKLKNILKNEIVTSISQSKKHCSRYETSIIMLLGVATPNVIFIGYDDRKTVVFRYTQKQQCINYQIVNFTALSTLSLD